ncbi:MAG: hypothetical protein H6Q86_5551 [candidate division NC10 bacterium]|jgi:hypothetical protein|nr:hypothetical protein [candidate division NC10 bacterium]
MRDDIRLKARYADLFQWVKDQGYWPKRFRSGHTFLIPVTQQIKPYHALTPAQFRQALWVPCPEDVPFTVTYHHPDEAPDVFLVDLFDPATRKHVAFGYGMSRIDALLSALQAIRMRQRRRVAA